MPQISPHIEDIIGKKPNWLIRFGISGMLFMLLTLLFVAWFVKYPDVINATVFISTPNPPIDLVCPIDAQIEEIFIYDAEKNIKRGAPLILLKSTTSYNQIKELKNVLEGLVKDSLLEKPIVISGEFSNLGVLQNNYNQMTNYIEEHNEYLDDETYKRQIGFLEKIINYNKKSLKSLEQRFLLELEDQKMVAKAKNRADILFTKGVIAEIELDAEEQKFLSKEIQMEGYRASLINQESNIVNLQKQLAELKMEENHFKHEIKSSIKNSVKILHSQIDEWTNNFVISSPVTGTISVFKEFNKGDYLTAGNYLLTILPIEEQELFAYGSFSVANAGKLKVNSNAIIKLHAFPYREYGAIDGFIEKISDFPINDLYSVKIRLPKKLETGYNKKIIFKQRLTGEAELITENRSLLGRVFDNFTYLITEREKEE